MDEKETIPPGFLDTLRQAGATILAIVHNRLELLIVELQEHRVRLVEALLLLAAIAVLGFFTLSLAAAAVVILIWTVFGVWGLFMLSGLGLVATVLVSWQLRRRLKNWPLLDGTLAELKKDREWLENK